MSKHIPTVTTFGRRDALKTAVLAGMGTMLNGSALGLAIGADEYPAIRKAAENGRDASIKRI